MKIKLLYILLVAILFAACQEIQKKFLNSGRVTLEGKNYSLTQARFCTDSLVDGIYCAQLTFTPPQIRISENGVSGGGASYLHLAINLMDDTLALGTHRVGDSFFPNINASESFFITISSDKKDTSRIQIASGNINYSLQGDTMPCFVFNFISSGNDSITGNYLGTMIRNTSVDADSLGYYHRDEVVKALGYASMWNWGNIFDDELYYYELELLSNDMRWRDDGKMKGGAVLFIGFFSSDSIAPISGEYIVSDSPSNNTLFYGNKQTNTYWGTYWMQLTNTSISGRANITEGSATFTKAEENKYNIEFKFKDQLNHDIDGIYTGPIRIRKPY